MHAVARVCSCTRLGCRTKKIQIVHAVLPPILCAGPHMLFTTLLHPQKCTEPCSARACFWWAVHEMQRKSSALAASVAACAMCSGTWAAAASLLAGGCLHACVRQACICAGKGRGGGLGRAAQACNRTTIQHVPGRLLRRSICLFHVRVHAAA